MSEMCCNKVPNCDYLDERTTTDRNSRISYFSRLLQKWPLSSVCWCTSLVASMAASTQCSSMLDDKMKPASCIR